MIQIVCTKKLSTGGAELLHQLCFELNSIGVDSNMAYYNRKENQFIETEINSNYTKYCKYPKTFKLLDISGNTIIFPETMAYLAKNVKMAKVVIWWLSIDNYLINFNLEHSRNNGIKATLDELKKMFRRPSFNRLSDYLHISQSVYAKEFLLSKGINSSIVGDYLNTEFVGENCDLNDKKNIICYNPKKGLQVTKKIIDYYKKNNSNFLFVPIIGMNVAGVKSLMQKSKIYIDFGGHPGKDRLPREARIQDCVIVTGRKGAANNPVDISIDHKYKIDERDNDFLTTLDSLIKEIVGDFGVHLENQNDYKSRILQEKIQFTNQVKDFVKSLEIDK